MPFQPSENLPDFARLKATFTGARKQIESYLLYQTIIDFLDGTGKLKKIFSKQIADLEDTVIINTETINEQIHVFLLMGG
jgi:hypothetical protein